MKQRAHTWIAARAVGLLETEGQVPGLVDLLAPHVKEAAIGAWLPDLSDARLGSAKVDNHVLKMKPVAPALTHFRITKQDLLVRLTPERMLTAFLDRDTILDAAWWDQPYKAYPAPGQHLANRAMALTVTVVDLLLFGDREVTDLVPGPTTFEGRLAPPQLTRAEQAAMHFFMLSHFVADASMPLHCDARKLAAYGAGLHMEMESHWDRQVGTPFDKGHAKWQKMKAGQVIPAARNLDAKFGITFAGRVPELYAADAWAEVVHQCRASFALASILAPPAQFHYGDETARAPFDTVFGGAAGQALLAEVDRIILHDAVLNVAMVWKDIWKRF